MANTPPQRKYQMEDADLIQRADELVNSMIRDAEDFLTRKVDRSRRDELVTARNTFSDFPTDEELLGELNKASEDKDGLRDKLESAIRTIRGMADTQFGGKGFYKSFGFDDLSRKTDNGLIRMARRVVRIATRFKDELGNQGLKDTHLTGLTELAAKFDDGVDAVEQAVEERDINTQQRVLLGNALYDKMIEFADIGKSLYEDTDEAKYNDYVITDTPASPQAPGNQTE